jgi:two-component system, LytTR family, response regulator
MAAGVFHVKLRTLIVDDELPARKKIRAFLQDHPEFQVVAECSDGEQAVAAISAHKPDLLFLDVQIPGRNGFEVLSALPAKSFPAVIFVTAFDKYAVRAFEVRALDYLLKPFNKRESRDNERIAVKSGSRIILLRKGLIEWIEAQGDYVKLHIGKESHLLRETMAAAAERLDPNRFVRIHRSRIVNLDHVREIRPLWGGDYSVLMRDGTELTMSRTYRVNFQTALNGDRAPTSPTNR